MKKAFTLIELLVVIAIIAILAAILFPVFAQAKEAAKKIACLSNEKQLTLGVLMYQNDYDDNYPIGNAAWLDGFQGDWEAQEWASATVPYIKSVGIFGCPDDSLGGKVDPSNSWQGIQISYAANGLQVPWVPSGNAYCKGLMCQSGDVVNAGSVNQPSAVIMLAESHDDQLKAANWQENYSAGFGGIFTGVGFDLQFQLPNQCGTLYGGTSCGTFPLGIDGAVSVHGGNQSNFSFADGHVKSLNPVVTVPDNTSPATVSGSVWYTPFGQYNTGATNSKLASMWEADHV
jgi:prepilin-type N-terminal cleavage/methylation domain-containing protein/prepilin-type processing-associated H-X9-DG protein